METRGVEKKKEKFGENKIEKRPRGSQHEGVEGRDKRMRFFFFFTKIEKII